MRLVLMLILMLLSPLSFADSPGVCTLKVTEGGESTKEIGNANITVGRGSPAGVQIGQWKNLTFSYRFHSSGAAGPYDSIGLEWTDGTNTYETPVYLVKAGQLIQLSLRIQTPTDLVQANCFGQPWIP